MRKCAFLLVFAAVSFAAEAPRTFTGVIGDDMCDGDHKTMDGTDPAKCTAECVAKMHSKYALWVGKDIYVLSDQKVPAKYAGRKVRVTGVVGSEGTGKDKVTTLTVRSIAPAK